MRRLTASVALCLLVAGCATVPGAPPPPPAPPGEGASGGGTVLRDWRGVVTPTDRDRLNRLDAAWRLALEQARRQEGSGDLRSTGDLIDPGAARRDVEPPEGAYRCRTVKLGSQSDGGLGYVVYGWFACQIERTPNGLKLSKLTGSQRPAGLLFPENGRSMVFLGSMSLADEAPARTYGRNPARDVVARLERIGDARWRLVIPFPQTESNLDLIELVPAR